MSTYLWKRMNQCHKIPESSCAALVRAAQQGDRLAYDGIVRRYQAMAVTFAASLLGGNRQNAEDAAQDSFVEAYLHLAGLKDPHAFPGWFRTIVHRRCARQIRRSARETFPLHLTCERALASAMSGAELEEHDPVRRVVSREARDEISTAVSELAEAERLVVLLYYFGEHSVSDVAAFLSLPSNTVKKRLQSARRKLKTRMTPPMPEKSNISRREDAIATRVREMLHASASGDLTVVKTLLEIDPAFAKVVDDDFATPLHMAVESDNAEVAQALIAAGADLNAKYNRNGHTPLSWAVTCGSFQVARALVDGGAPLDLWCATGLGDLHTTQSFWDSHGRMTDHPSITGSSRYDADGKALPRPPALPRDVISDALYIAARNGHGDVVSWLLDHGADVRFRGFEGGTPLHWAYFANSRPVIDLLLRHGADLECLDYENQASPRAFGILEAVSFGLSDRVREMVAADPSLVACRGRYGTPLHRAARWGHTNIAAILLEFGAGAVVVNPEGETPRDLASRHGHVEIVRMLETAMTNQ